MEYTIINVVNIQKITEFSFFLFKQKPHKIEKDLIWSLNMKEMKKHYS